MLPRAILFDLDDTIIFAHGDMENAWLTVAKEFAKDLFPVTPVEFTDVLVSVARTFWSDTDRHRYWRLRILAARREIVGQAVTELTKAGQQAPSTDIAHKIADRFSAYRDETMHLFPDAHQVLDEFRNRGVALTLITNGASDVQRAKVNRFELEQRFDHIQIEGEHDFGKPDERAYLHALNQHNAAPSEAWIVGDNLEWEVAAPQRLGLHSIWVDSNEKGLPENTNIKPDRIIRTLSELL